MSFSVVCYLTGRYWPARSLPAFFMQIAAVLPLFPLALAVVYRAELMQHRARRFFRIGVLEAEQ